MSTVSSDETSEVVEADREIVLRFNSGKGVEEDRGLTGISMIMMG